MARPLKVVKGEEKPRNAAEALGGQKMEFLECRDLRHPWRSLGMFYATVNGRREVHRKLVCERCGTEATDRWSPKGMRIVRAYKYAPGYEAHVGIRIKPVDVRREVLNRLPVFGSEEEMLASLFRGGRRKRA